MVSSTLDGLFINVYSSTTSYVPWCWCLPCYFTFFKGKNDRGDERTAVEEAAEAST